MLKTLEKELMKLNEMQKEVEKAIKEAPEGSFRCSSNRGYHQYYQGKEYLNKTKKEFVRKIAQKDYCNQMKDKIKTMEKSIYDLIELYEEMEQVYCKLTPGRKVLVAPLINPIENIIKEFEKIEYNSKEFDEEDVSEYYTSKGERVRSKSEILIADELNRNNIPYKYEMPLELDSWGRKITIYPDFTVLNRRTGRKWYIEHLGMMDNPGYYEKAMIKLDTYEKNEIILGGRLLIFHETATLPLNVRIMRKYIEQYLT